MTEKSLQGKKALITGASRGIGAAIAKEFARHGAHVILLARSIRDLELVDDAIKADGGFATLIPQDLTKLDELDSMGVALQDRFGGLDILIGNAGMLGTLGPLPHTKPAEWNNVFDVNVHANFRLIRTLDPLLRAAPSGRALFVSTGAGVVDGRAYWGAYAASKAALESMVKAYAQEIANTTMRVNVIDPGAVRTKMRATAKPGEDPMTLPAPEGIAPKFIPLVLDTYQKNGEIIKL